MKRFKNNIINKINYINNYSSVIPQNGRNKLCGIR